MPLMDLLGADSELAKKPVIQHFALGGLQTRHHNLIAGFQAAAPRNLFMQFFDSERDMLARFLEALRQA